MPNRPAEMKSPPTTDRRHDKAKTADTEHDEENRWTGDRPALKKRRQQARTGYDATASTPLPKFFTQHRPRDLRNRLGGRATRDDMWSPATPRTNYLCDPIRLAYVDLQKLHVIAKVRVGGSINRPPPHHCTRRLCHILNTCPTYITHPH